MNARKLLLSISVVALLLVSAVTVYAATVAAVIPADCLDSVVIGEYTICLMGHDDNGDGTTTWTYGARRDVGVSGGALSHITLSICVDDQAGLIAPTGGTYTTLGSYIQPGSPDDKEFTGRDGITYNTTVGFDPTTGVVGLKYEEGSPEQNAGDVDIFQFTQPTQTNPDPVSTTIGFKNGNGGFVGAILGPDCSTSAVEITSLKARSASLFSILLQLLGLR